MIRFRFILGVALLALPAPALAQHAATSAAPPAGRPDDMAGMDHSQMGRAPARPAPSSVPAKRARRAPANPTGKAVDHIAMPGMDHGVMRNMTSEASPRQGATSPASQAGPSPAPTAAGGMPGMDHGAMNRSAMPGMTGGSGTDQTAGDAPAPAPPEPNYADRVWGRAAMAPARADLRREHGGLAFRQVNGNLLEYQGRDGTDGLRWDGEGWYGADLDRIFLRSEGRTNNDKGLEEAEVQLLYGRTIGAYTFLQAGVRQDIAPIGRTYASLGFETLVPYWIDLEGTVFLSTRGDLLARAEATYDLRLTQRMVLQPRVELNLAAQTDRAAGIGSGVSDLELGLRLRYEVRREFAPYVGVSYDRDFGDTARFTRARGQKPGGVSFVVGVRSWF